MNFNKDLNCFTLISRIQLNGMEVILVELSTLSLHDNQEWKRMGESESNNLWSTTLSVADEAFL